MTTTFLIVGLIALIAGIALIFAPKGMIRAGEFFNRLRIRNYITTHRNTFGVMFIVVGILCLILSR